MTESVIHSADLIEEYDSIWLGKDPEINKYLEYKVGHTLFLKDSLIDHHESGQGVFVSCRT